MLFGAGQFVFVILAAAFIAVAIVAVPAFQGVFTKQVETPEQAKLQGGTNPSTSLGLGSGSKVAPTPPHH